MSENYLLSIDLGTTVEKCVLYTQNGEVIAEAQQEIEIIYPKPGQAEIPALPFYTLTCENIKKCINDSKINPKNVRAVSVDSLMGGVIGIDKKYNPITYYDTCLDTRDAAESDYVLNNFGDLVLEKNGSCSIWGHKILYWKKKNEWRDICKFVQPAAFVAGKLASLSGNDAFIDQSFLCFSALSDLKKSEWSEELLTKLEVDREKLPRIIKATDIIGETTGEVSKTTGLPRGIPICAGCGDVTAGYIGAGILKQGQMVDISGTANILAVNISEYKYDENIACIKSPINDTYYLMSNVLGGRTHKWFVEEFFTEEIKKITKKGGNIYSYLDEHAKSIQPGSDGLLAIDDLQGRFFPPDPSMRGLFIGHTWSHKKIHFYRAILESIAYDHYFTRNIILGLLPNLDLKSVIAIGSGAESQLWLQIKADVLQLPFQNLFRSGLSTLGSAMIAGYAVGLYKSIEESLKGILKVKKEVIPKSDEFVKYSKYIHIYIELLDLLKETYRKLSS